MVSEFCSGGDLQMYMSNQQYEPLDEARANDFVFKIAQGLKHLHDRNIIHLDIKPENILMSDNSKNAMPIITDFGSSKILKNEDQTCTELRGTKGFMAPELLNRTPYSLPVDIFSLGVLLFVLVSSHLPFPYLKEKLTEESAAKYHAMI